MAVYDILPKTNLKQEDIRDTLNAHGASVGEYGPEYFGEDANLDMWSRYKPLRISADFINLFDNDNWKGTDGQCGINFSAAILTNYKNVVGKVTADSNNGWVYAIPLGGASSPLRMGDFRGYYPNAKPPVSGFSVPARVAVGGTLNAQIMYNLSNLPDDGSYSPGSIGLNEFSYENVSFESYHFGIVVTDSGDNFLGRSFSGGDGLTSCTYLTTGLVEGRTYKAWPLIAKTAMGQSDADVANTYICLPLCGAEEFKVVSKAEADGLKIYLTAKYVYTDGVKRGISFKLEITSVGGISLTNNVIQMRFSTSAISGAMMAGEKSQKVLDISTSSSYSYEGLFSIDANYRDRDFYLYGSFDAGAYVTGKVYPEETIID